MPRPIAPALTAAEMREALKLSNGARHDAPIIARYPDGTSGVVTGASAAVRLFVLQTSEQVGKAAPQESVKRTFSAFAGTDSQRAVYALRDSDGFSYAVVRAGVDAQDRPFITLAAESD